MAAVLACGDDAVLSHRSAAALWEIGVELRGQIDISIRRRTFPRHSGLRIHARPTLRDSDVATRFDIPLTDPVQTLVDLATELPARRMERAVNDADKHGLVTPETLRRDLEGHAGRPGARTLRTLLDRHTFLLSDSELERLFVPLALEAGLTLPLSKHSLNGFEVDFYWPELGLVVETDGWRYHRTPATCIKFSI